MIGPGFETTVPTTRTRVETSLSFERDDFAALAAEFRRKSRGKVDILLGLAFVGVMVLGARIASIGQARRWSDALAWGLLALTWGVASIPLIVGWKWRRRLLKSLSLLCPHCGAPLVDTLRQAGRAELVVATGACPECSGAIFPEAAGDAMRR